MKKLLCMLLCLLLTVAVLAGCTVPADPQDDNTTAGSNGASEGVHYDADGNLVVPQHEGVTLTIGIPKNTNVLDYYDNYYTKWLEKMTGITLEFREYGYAAADYQKQLATEAAVPGQLPDILWNFGLGDSLLTQYGDDGYFVDISDYMEDENKAAILHQKLEEMKNDPNGDWAGTADRVWKVVYADNSENAEDGDYPIYGVPKINTSLVDNLDFIPYINTNWLKAVNKEMPKTKEELVDVLKAFRDIDCNGNGTTTEQIPMIGLKPGQLAGDTLAWLINFFVYCQDESMFNIDENGKLYLPQTTDKYREALEWIKMLIDEKLLHANTLTYTSASLKSVLSNGDMVGVVIGQPSLIFASGNNSPINRFEVLDLFGNVYYNQDKVEVRNFITDSCEDVDAAFDLLMLMSTWESAVIQRYGEENVNWERTDGTTMTTMGIPANLKILKDEWGTPQNLHWHTCNGFNTYETFDLIDNSGTDAWSNKKWEHLGKVTQYYKAGYEETKQLLGAEKILPYLRLNTEEEEIAKNRADVKKAIETWTMNFINGSKPIDDANWAQYLRELETAGSKDWIAAAQLCYERMYPNGHVSN